MEKFEEASILLILINQELLLSRAIKRHRWQHVLMLHLVQPPHPLVEIFARNPPILDPLHGQEHPIVKHDLVEASMLSSPE